jgi:hypothetical protein
VLQELDASAQTVGSAAAAVVSLQVMEAVVSEFSLVTASALGLSWEFHENCRNQLEVRTAGCLAALGWVCNAQMTQASWQRYGQKA